MRTRTAVPVARACISMLTERMVASVLAKARGMPTAPLLCCLGYLMCKCASALVGGAAHLLVGVAGAVEVVLELLGRVVVLDRVCWVLVGRQQHARTPGGGGGGRG